MSGGHFDHQQYNCWNIADEVASMINANGEREVPYSDETIDKFREAEWTLRRAYVMTNRIDWLVSSDDSEDSFHARWKESLAKLERNRK